MEAFRDVVSDIYNQFKDKWHSTRTLLILLIVAVLVLLRVFAVVDLNRFSRDELILSILVLLALYFVWYATTRVQKPPKNKVGFGVALVTENKEQQAKIYHDFIVTLRDLLYKSRFRYQFAFINYPQYFAEKLESGDHATQFLMNNNLRFLIYGRVRTRKLDDKETHILQLDGVVAHKDIGPEFQKQFSAEFSELFPKRMEIMSQNDHLSFEFGAEFLRIVAMYIISFAALISGDINYSQDLLEALNEELKVFRLENPTIVKIRARGRQRLIDVYAIQSFSLMRNWEKTKDMKYALEAGPALDRLQRLDPGNYDGHIQRALWLFVTKQGRSKERA